MMVLMQHLRSGIVSRAALIIAVLGLAGPTTVLGERGEIGSEERHIGVTTDGIADIIFPVPKRYAVIQLSDGKVQRLYTRGDVFFRPHNPRQFIRILLVDAGGMVVALNARGEKRFVTPGPLVPAAPEVILVGTVVLKQIQYRFKVVDRVKDPEPVVVSLGATRAVLEKEVLRLPHQSLLTSRRKVGLGGEEHQDHNADLFKKVKVKKVDDHTFEVDKETVLPIIEDVGERLSNVRLTPDPSFFGLTSSSSLNMKSSLGQAILNSGGFTIQNINVAQTFGLQVGDIVMSLNGRPLNSPLSAYMTFQELFIKNRNLKELRVQLLRGGAVRTTAYRIR